MKAVRAEGLHVEEKVSVGLDAMQRQVDRDQDELALDVLVRHGAAVALRVGARRASKTTRKTKKQKTNRQTNTPLSRGRARTVWLYMYGDDE